MKAANRSYKSIRYILLGAITAALFLPVSLATFELSLHAFRYINLLTSPRNQITFYVIGGSTSYGSPYNERPSFAKLIEDALNKKYRGLNINIRMLAAPGKTLRSNLYDLKKEFFTTPRRNAVILVYAGINETVSTSYREDFFWENIFNKSITGSIIYRFYEKLREQEKFSNSSNNSLFRYKSRLENLIYWAGHSNHLVYLSELVENVHDAPRLHSCFSHPDKEPSPDQFRNLVTCESQEEISEKIRCYQDFKEKNEDLFPSLDFIIAREKYRAAPNAKNWKSLNFISYQQCPLYQKNNIVREVASKNDNTILVPLVKEFQAYEDGLLGYNLFRDSFHPNLKGMVIMANQFLSYLTEDKIKTQSIDDIRKKYQIDSTKRQDTLLWSSIHMAISSTLDYIPHSPSSFYFFHRGKELIKSYYSYDSQMAQIMEYIIHPVLPTHLEIKPQIDEVLFSNADKFGPLYDHLFGKWMKNPVALKRYLSMLDRAKESSLISNDLYYKYLAFLQIKKSGNAQSVKFNTAHRAKTDDRRGSEQLQKINDTMFIIDNNGKNKLVFQIEEDGTYWLKYIALKSNAILKFKDKHGYQFERHVDAGRGTAIFKNLMRNEYQLRVDLKDNEFIYLSPFFKSK